MWQLTKAGFLSLPQPSAESLARLSWQVADNNHPFAMSTFHNVAFGLRLNRYRGDVAEKVERALHGAALWDEVKDKLRQSGN